MITTTTTTLRLTTHANRTQNLSSRLDLLSEETIFVADAPDNDVRRVRQDTVVLGVAHSDIGVRQAQGILRMQNMPKRLLLINYETSSDNE
jgi:hypothetical protein